MSDYIKKEDAVERVAYELMYEAAIAKGLTYKELIELEAKKQEKIKLYVQKWLEQVSSADVVEVVRCKDCKRGGWRVSELDNKTKGYRCAIHAVLGFDFGDNGYCSYGKRKDHE